MRQRVFAIGQDFYINHAEGQPCFKIDGKVRLVKESLKFRDLQGNQLYKLDEKLIRIRESFDILKPDGSLVAVPVSVTTPDYHELYVFRTNVASGAVTNQLVRFIVSASERNGSEDGLPLWTPHPLIPSASAEFVRAQLRLVTPRSFPAGYPVPVVVSVESRDGEPVRVNGALEALGHPSILIRRGAGSGFLAATNPVGPLDYSARVGGLETSCVVQIESAAAWTAVLGTLAANTVWPADSRIHVTGALTNPAGGTLTIRAGTVVRVKAGLDVHNFGRISIEGTVAEPVVFMPAWVTGQPWGGFVQHANNTDLTASGAIFTGSGANQGCWFTGHGCSSSLSGISSHRSEGTGRPAATA